jgi:hypothetical protein
MLHCKIKLSKAPEVTYAHNPNTNTTEGIHLSSTTEAERILSLNLNEPIGERQAFPTKKLIRIKLLPGNDQVTSSWILDSSIWTQRTAWLTQNTQSSATPGSNAPGPKRFSPGATANKKKSTTLFILLVYA